MLFSFLLMQGCYTQLHNIRRDSSLPVQEMKNPDGGNSDVADTFYFTVDTVFDNNDTAFDTSWYTTQHETENENSVVVQPGSFPRCLWTRDFLGTPQLECFDSWIDYNRYLNVQSPWWVRDNLYGYRSWDCPPGYYYDPYSGFCRHATRFRRRFHNRHPPRSTMEPEQSETGPTHSPRNPRRYGIGSTGHTGSIDHSRDENTGTRKKRQHQSRTASDGAEKRLGRSDTTSQSSGNGDNESVNKRQRKNPRRYQ